MWQILICGKLFGTHHACAHPVSQLYNHPNGWALLLSPESWLVGTTEVYSAGADIVMESITLTERRSESKYQFRQLPCRSSRAPQNNRLPMLSFRDAAIPNAGRNHYSIHKQVLPSYGMPTLPPADRP